nr:glyoxysomal processing protease, glyoxysomal isoform X2 [Ipomoea batatas]
MSIQEVIDVARNFAVMVRIQGPDPKGLKMRKHAFHLYNSGRTTLSASGMLLPRSLVNASVAKQNVGEGNLQSMGGYVLVMTVASVIEPFLSQQHRDSMSKGKEAYTTANKEALHWVPAELLRLVGICQGITCFP